MDQAIHTIKDCLLYPLKFGNIVVILVMSAIGSFLFYTFSISLVDSGTGFARLLFIMGMIVFYPAINGLFEHGLDIIETSAKGKTDPPVPGISTLRGGRFIKQLSMLILFLGFALFLVESGNQYSVLIFILLALPASLAIHSVYDNFLDMINPVILVRLAMTIGLPYLLSVVPLILIALIVRQMPEANLLQLLLMMLAILYLVILFFRFLGQCVYLQRGTLVTEVDFTTEQKQAAESDQASLEFNKVFLKAYELIRAGKMEQAEKLILPVAEVNSWARFDNAFRIISQWQDKKPALTLTKTYIPVLVERQHYMRALELCRWSLGQDSNYMLNQDADLNILGILVEQAVSKEQYQTVVQLIENYVRENPTAENAANLLFTAADISQEKLNNQAQYEQFMKRLKEIDPEFFLKVSGKT